MSLRIANLLCLMLITSASFCYAGDGVCHSDKGTIAYNLTLNNAEIPAEKNEAGTEVRDFKTLSSSQTYKAHCDCLTRFSTIYSNIYYTARSPLSIDSTRGGYTYYTLNNNLSIATGIHILGYDFVPVPFEGVKNAQTGNKYCFTSETSHDGDLITLDSGSKVNISFLINEAFIGKVTIPPTIVADLYGGISSDASIASTDKLAEIKISGDVTAPQNCEIAPGQTLEVDFGKIESSAFSSTKGTAVSSHKVKKTILVQCTGMSDDNIVYSTFRADPVDSDGMMMKVTGNDDVGIAVYDKWDRPVNVNGGAMDMDMGANQGGKESNSLTFSAAPASATGSQPQPGTFEAYATITLEIKN